MLDVGEGSEPVQVFTLNWREASFGSLREHASIVPDYDGMLIPGSGLCLARYTGALQRHFKPPALRTCSAYHCRTGAAVGDRTENENRNGNGTYGNNRTARPVA